MYDCTSMESMQNIEKWLALYRDNKPEGAACVICANKIDLREEYAFTEIQKDAG